MLAPSMCRHCAVNPRFAPEPAGTPRNAPAPASPSLSGPMQSKVTFRLGLSETLAGERL